MLSAFHADEYGDGEFVEDSELPAHPTDEATEAAGAEETTPPEAEEQGVTDVNVSVVSGSERPGKKASFNKLPSKMKKFGT